MQERRRLLLDLRFQGRVRRLELLRHEVEIPTELADLVRRVEVGTLVETPLGVLRDHAAQGTQRTTHAAVDQDGQDHRQEQPSDRHVQDGAVDPYQVVLGLPLRLLGLLLVEVADLVQMTVEFAADVEERFQIR